MKTAMRQIPFPYLLLVALACPGCRQQPTYTLKITFEGAVAFAPDKAAPDKRRVWALLPNGEEPDQSNLKKQLTPDWGVADQRLYINLHQPFIRIAGKYLSDQCSCSLCDMPVYLSLSSKAARAPNDDPTDRHGHDISFEEPFDGDGVADLCLKDVPYLGNQDNHDDPHRPLDPSVLTDPDPRKRVVARLRLDTGSLKSSKPYNLHVEFGYYKKNSPREEDFTRMGSPVSFAPTAEARLVFHQAPLTLVLTGFSESGVPGDVQRFPLHPVDNRIEIAVLNEPADEILGRQDAGRHSISYAISDHFLLYYLLSKAWNTPPFLLPEKVDGGHGGQPYCGLAQFPPP